MNIKRLKIFSLFLALVSVILCFSGCGKRDSGLADSSVVNISSVASEVEVVVTDKSLYVPHSLTVSFYDAANSTYGFTWNTNAAPYEAVLQVCEGKDFNEANAKEYKANVESLSGAYICKARAELSANKLYSYRVYDKKAKVGSDIYTINGRNVSGGKFTFAHLSDSQVSDETTEAAKPLGRVFESISSRYENLDFLIHTGDVVQNGGKEADWRNMLEPNIDFISSTPFMAISGNHCSHYGGTDYNTYKHFDVLKPEQSYYKGYYYSFEYSNAKFIMLDTNRLNGDNTLTSDQYDWLVSELQNNNKQWTIVSLHNPLYSVGKYGADPDKNAIALALKIQLNDLFVKNGVDLVLQGHDHAYSYTYPIATGNIPLKDATIEDGCYVNPKGVVYAMHGPAGNQARNPYKKDDSVYKYAAGASESSWAEVTVDGNLLYVSVFGCDANGEIELKFNYGIMKK